MYFGRVVEAARLYRQCFCKRSRTVTANYHAPRTQMCLELHHTHCEHAEERSATFFPHLVQIVDIYEMLSLTLRHQVRLELLVPLAVQARLEST